MQNPVQISTDLSTRPKWKFQTCLKSTPQFVWFLLPMLSCKVNILILFCVFLFSGVSKFIGYVDHTHHFLNFPTREFFLAFEFE